MSKTVCNCIAEVNAKLAERNTKLTESIVIKDGTMDLCLLICTEVVVQLPVHLLGLHGHVAIQPQQIKPNNAPHAHPRFRRGHYRARVTSQLKVAA